MHVGVRTYERPLSPVEGLRIGYSGSMDEEIDVEATKRVANRAVISAVIAFLAVGPTVILPAIIAIPFLVIALGVGISAVRTLLHQDAAVIGGLRWVGVVLALIATLSGALLLLSHAFVMLGVLR